MKVSEIMNKAIVVDDNMSIREAAKVMSDKNIGSLIVMKKEEIVGIVAESDILKNIGKTGEKVSKIMSRNVFTVEQGDSIESAAMVLAENKIKRLPVVKDGKLVGIVTATDLIAHSDALSDDFLID